ncbi:MAG: Cof-type HAD-IIB family hydrolase [Candidatus Kapabacteria bacterium]|nr:Cof-type HAD-IIB family hydrolase [Candidatus Kapabacteria bacterium]MDW8012079.1 HAD family hydrolase [Bacteroidota bacterium]
MMLWRWWRALWQPTLADIRLLVSDVDGTLVIGEETLPDSTAELLRSLHRCGVQLALASARPYPSLAALVRQAHVSAWIISLDGALLHAPDGELRFSVPFPAEILRSLVELAGHYAVHYATFTPEGLYRMADVHIPSYLDDPLLPRFQAQLLADFFRHPAVLFCLSGPQAHALGFVQAVESLPRRIRRHLSIAAVESASQPGLTVVEIRMRAAHKGTAAQALQKLLGIPRRATLAVGDYRNDLSLFAIAGLRVAMADAVAELRSKADWITERPATERGIDDVLRRLLQEC